MTRSLRPLVVKIGGSLLDLVPELVPVLGEAKRPLLLVPGGGLFADLVRELSPDDESGHWMAIAAMEQIGWYIAGYGVPPTDRLAVPGRMTVFLPYAELRRRDPLPHSWDVTSDTIAAWTAATLGLDLLLLKSVDGLFRDGRLVGTVGTAIPCDEVDRAFLDFVLERGIRTTIVNGRNLRRVSAAVAGGRVEGTVVDPSY
jgi:aspartokinase-like uncharacterized kinase